MLAAIETTDRSLLQGLLRLVYGYNRHGVGYITYIGISCSGATFPMNSEVRWTNLAKGGMMCFCVDPYTRSVRD